MIQDCDRDGARLTVTCCKSCGLAYVDPLPSPDELTEFYAQRYREEYKKTSAPKLRHVYRAGRVALDRLGILATIASAPARVLDCGAGGGEFTYLLASRGFRAIGIEPNDAYRDYAAREYDIDIRAGTVEETEFASNEFDVITMFHVLEHLRDPAVGLRRLASWLKNGGHLVVEVPNALTGVSSPGNLYHRAHLYYFASQPLQQMACDCGLLPVKIAASPAEANLLAVFKKQTDPASDRMRSGGAFAHDALVNANRSRTLRRYLLSATTVASIPRRISSRSKEYVAQSAFPSGKAMLDHLYAQEAAQFASAI